MQIMMMAASLRKDSVNKKLLHRASTLLTEHQLNIDIAEFSEFNVPLYDGDVQESSGIPAGAQYFVKRMHANQGLILVTPEYNYSIPGTLKNLIDWVSRITPMPWNKQHILLLSASPSLVGGYRGLWQTRIPLEGCGAFVYPAMFGLSSAYSAFNADGAFIDTNIEQNLKKLLDEFITHIKKG